MSVILERRPPDPGIMQCCGGLRKDGHKPDCITVVGYWRWLLFGWRRR